MYAPEEISALVLRGLADHVYLTQRLSRLLDTAEREAGRLKDEYISVEHLEAYAKPSSIKISSTRRAGQRGDGAAITGSSE